MNKAVDFKAIQKQIAELQAQMAEPIEEACQKMIYEYWMPEILEPYVDVRKLELGDTNCFFNYDGCEFMIPTQWYSIDLSNISVYGQFDVDYIVDLVKKDINKRIMEFIFNTFAWEIGYEENDADKLFGVVFKGLPIVELDGGMKLSYNMGLGRKG